MKWIPVCFLFIFSCIITACHTNNGGIKKNLPVADTAKYYPLNQFFKEQLQYVDLRNFSIYQLSNVDGKKDSSSISKDELLAWGTFFIRQSAFFQQNKQLYKESVFQDLSTKSYTLNYTPFDQHTTDIQNIDILLDDETNIVKRVFIKRVYTAGDTTITEQYNWKAYKSFQLTRYKTTMANYTSSGITYVNWNDQ
jgi:hypothetical protein